MEGNKRPASIFRRELRTGVEHHIDGRPMRGKSGDRQIEFVATAGDLSVSAIFGIQQELLLAVVVEVVRPAEVRPLSRTVHRLGGPLGVLLCRKHVTPKSIELVAAVHYDVPGPIAPGEGRD